MTIMAASRTHHVVLKPLQSQWLDCPQTGHIFVVPPPWKVIHPEKFELKRTIPLLQW